MSKLIRWQPMGETVTLRDAMDRLFDEARRQSSLARTNHLSVAFTLEILVYRRNACRGQPTCNHQQDQHLPTGPSMCSKNSPANR